MTSLSIGEPMQMYPTTKAAVLSFVTSVLNNNISQTFTGEELRHFVENRTGKVSPTTVDRALRQLRLEYKLDYIVENRGRSLYRAVPVVPQYQG